MALTPQDLVRVFGAAAAAIPSDDKPGIYLISEDANDLVEEYWVGGKLGDNVFVGDGVKKDTPAVYIIDGDERYVFCVSEDGGLRRYKFDEEEDSWEQSDLQGDGDIKIHASSRLSGGIVDGSIILFYEDESTRLQGIRIQSDGSWGPLPALHIDAKPGRPHAITSSDDSSLHLTYLHADGELHRISIDVETAESTDHGLAGTAFSDDEIAGFLPATPEDPSSQHCVLTSKGHLFQIDKEGVRTDIGKIQDGIFIPHSREENGPAFAKMLKGAVRANTGGGSK